MPEMTSEEIDKLVEKMIDIVLPGVKPLVAEIEAKPLTTLNHYGDYLSLLPLLIEQSPPSLTSKFWGCVLIKAGANPRGVKSALACF